MHALDEQLRVNNTPRHVGRAHRSRSNWVKEANSILADITIDVIVASKVLERADEVPVEGRRAEVSHACLDALADDVEVEIVGEKVRVDEGCGEGVGRVDADGTVRGG